MSTYKVIQDIEAEDKLFGPLTLKQFIFACVAIVSGYLCFWSFVNGLSFLLVVFLPPTMFFALLSFPWSKEQTTEVWIMAKLRFFFRPRRRIWDQTGIKELVTITVPKHEEKHYTDGLSSTEVRSRLKALASTIDSRGWAIKDANLNIATQTPYLSSPSDRLVQSQSLPQDVRNLDVGAGADMLDEQNNPEAQRLDQMIKKSESSHRDKMLRKISNPEPDSTTEQNDYWFMRQAEAPKKANVATFGASPIVNPGTKTEPEKKPLSDSEKKLLDRIHKQKGQPNLMNSHLKRILPLSEQEQAAEQPESTPAPSGEPAEPQVQKPPEAPVPDTAKADILNKVNQLARNNDRSVESLSREVNQVDNDSSKDEVVVSLH